MECWLALYGGLSLRGRFESTFQKAAFLIVMLLSAPFMEAI